LHRRRLGQGRALRRVITEVLVVLKDLDQDAARTRTSLPNGCWVNE
jgi:hypothetical protein